MAVRFIMAATALCLAAPAAAQVTEPVQLEPGRSVTLRVDAEGNIAESRDQGTAEWQDYELAVARHLSGQTPPEAPVPTASPVPAGMPEAEPIPARSAFAFCRLPTAIPCWWSPTAMAARSSIGHG